MSPIFTAETTGDEVVAAFPDAVKGKIFLVTGPSPKGIGAATLYALAKGHPDTLVLAGRNPSAFLPVAQQISVIDSSIKIVSVAVDLSSISSVRKAAAEILADEEVPHIDVLINNAGVMATPFGRTIDGLETQFGTNHVGPFLLTMTLFPKLLKSSAPRVVNTTSSGHRFGTPDFSDSNWESTPYNAWRAYGQSKLANILFTNELARRYGSQGLLAYSAHPGSISTNLGRHMNEESRADVMRMISQERDFENLSMKSLEQGCSTTLVAALSPVSRAVNGAYFADAQVWTPKDTSSNPQAALELWGISEKVVGEKF